MNQETLFFRSKFFSFAEISILDPQHLRSGQLTPGEVRQVHEASAELSRLPILIDDHPMTSMDRVRSSARLLKSKNRCDMVMVHYLQLCDTRSDQKNRNR